MKKRGQAAMEFLMTYGWALLVVLVAIGALAFFGVLDPGRFLPSSCTLFPGLGCIDFKADTANDEITLVIQNGIGDNINITDIGAEGCGANNSDMIISDGAEYTILIDCGADLGTSGSKYKGDIYINYTTGSSTFSHTKFGRLVTQIE